MPKTDLYRGQKRSHLVFEWENVQICQINRLNHDCQKKLKIFFPKFQKMPPGGSIETKFPERTLQKIALLYTFAYFIVQFRLFSDKGSHNTVLNFFFHFWPKKWPLGGSKMTKNQKNRIIPIKPHKMLILII